MRLVIKYPLIITFEEKKYLVETNCFATIILVCATTGTLEEGMEINQIISLKWFYNELFYYDYLDRRAYQIWKHRYINYLIRCMIVDTVSWDEVITRYVQDGYIERDNELFNKMIVNVYLS